MPNEISKEDALRILNARKSGYQHVVEGSQKDGTSYLRLQVDERVVAEFAGKDGHYTKFSTTWDITPENFGKDAARLKTMPAASDLKALNAPNIDKERCEVTLEDGSKGVLPLGINVSEGDFLVKFTNYASDVTNLTTYEDNLINTSLLAIEGICQTMPSVIENAKTPDSRRVMAEVITTLAKQFDLLANASPDATSRQTFANNLRKMSESITR